MCGLFLSTHPIRDGARRQIEFFLQRRGTLPVRWVPFGGAGVCAHSLLPLRGLEPRLQPLQGAEGILLFTGELWDAGAYQCDTDKVCATLTNVSPHRAFALFDGNWAIVYARSRDRGIHFATDCLGEQPLHYATCGDALAVASEMKLLIAAGYSLNDVKPVVPGIHYRFDVTGGGLTQRPYRPGRSGSSKSRSFSTRVLRGHIRAAVHEQALARNANEEVAILFSGGLDSSIVAYEAARIGIRRAFTVAIDRNASDALQAGAAARALGLNWHLIVAQPAAPAAAIAAGEIANRSIVEEMTMHLPLAAHLRELGIHVALTGCGADELFVGYQHLLGRIPHHLLQTHLLSSYYRFDLRALGKLYSGFQIELRNPFLSRRVVDYASRIDSRVLVGARRELKVPLRAAYRRILPFVAMRPKLIARETMGVKALFARRYGDSPYLYRRAFKRILRSTYAARRALSTGIG